MERAKAFNQALHYPWPALSRSPGGGGFALRDSIFNCARQTKRTSFERVERESEGGREGGRERAREGGSEGRRFKEQHKEKS